MQKAYNKALVEGKLSYRTKHFFYWNKKNLPRQKICGLFFVTLQSNNNIYELKKINRIKIVLVEKKNDKNVSHNK